MRIGQTITVIEAAPLGVVGEVSDRAIGSVPLAVALDLRDAVPVERGVG